MAGAGQGGLASRPAHSFTLARWNQPVNTALLVGFYEELNHTRNLNRFVRQTRERYTEGTLQRLVMSHDMKARQVALIALGLVGTMASNELVAACLYDDKSRVRELAESTLWAIWFRADAKENNRELKRLMRLIRDEEYAKAFTGLNALISRAPAFAEAINQRAILYWNWGEFEKSIQDCERVLQLNPYHFGAQAGMAQCHLRLHNPIDALKAFRRALKIHPYLNGVKGRVLELETRLKQEEHRREERK